MARLDRLDERAREKLGIILITIFLLGWIAVSIGIQIHQANYHGYGTGITNQGHLPDEIRARYGVGPDVTKEQLMEMTNR